MNVPSSSDITLDVDGTTGASSSLPATPQAHEMSESCLPPRKRQRLEAPQPAASASAGMSTVLLALPGLCAVPPNHSSHILSYMISLRSLRACLAQGSLTPDVECRAWTAYAEIGCKIIGAGWSTNEAYPWARGLENEVRLAVA